MIRIHHAAYTRSLRVILLCEELGLPYEIVKHDFMAREHKRPEFLALNPFGRLPAIEDGPVHMFESGAILQYLLETYGKGRLQPAPGSPERPAFLQWFHFAEATAMGPVSDFIQHSFVKPEAERIPAVVAAAGRAMQEWLGILDQHLAGRTWLVGDAFSAADVMMAYSVNNTKFIGQLGDGHPNVTAWLDRVQARPSWAATAAA